MEGKNSKSTDGRKLRETEKVLVTDGGIASRYSGNVSRTRVKKEVAARTRRMHCRSGRVESSSDSSSDWAVERMVTSSVSSDEDEVVPDPRDMERLKEWSSATLAKELRWKLSYLVGILGSLEGRSVYKEVQWNISVVREGIRILRDRVDRAEDNLDMVEKKWGNLRLSSGGTAKKLEGSRIAERNLRRELEESSKETALAEARVAILQRQLDLNIEVEEADKGMKELAERLDDSMREIEVARSRRESITRRLLVSQSLGEDLKDERRRRFRGRATFAGIMPLSSAVGLDGSEEVKEACGMDVPHALRLKGPLQLMGAIWSMVSFWKLRRWRISWRRVTRAAG